MRFIKEYANEKKRRVQQDNTLSAEEKEEAIDIEKLAEKDEKAAERWCYMDLKRRGAIA